MYNMMTVVNTACTAYLQVVKRIDPKSSHHKEKKIFFSFSFFVSIRDDGY